MEDILIMTDKDGGTAVLTTNSPLSSYGIPVLRIDANDVKGDFGPADLIGEPPNLTTAAQVVAGWASQQERTPDEIRAAIKFLSQWVGSPKIPITIAKYAELHGKNVSSVWYKIYRGGFNTARKIGSYWVIDADEPYTDRRIKSGKYIKDKKE